MAWRIEEQVICGEIDNRTPGRVIGKLWLVGRDEAVDLELEGNPWRDLAGHFLKFTNPNAKPAKDDGARLSDHLFARIITTYSGLASCSNDFPLWIRQTACIARHAEFLYDLNTNAQPNIWLKLFFQAGSSCRQFDWFVKHNGCDAEGSWGHSPM